MYAQCIHISSSMSCMVELELTCSALTCLVSNVGVGVGGRVCVCVCVCVLCIAYCVLYCQKPAAQVCDCSPVCSLYYCLR